MCVEDARNAVGDTVRGTGRLYRDSNENQYYQLKGACCESPVDKFCQSERRILS